MNQVREEYGIINQLFTYSLIENDLTFLLQQLAIFRELLPQEYIERFTKESIREDGRQFEQIRSIKYLRNFNIKHHFKINPLIIKENEVTLLSMGQTLVMASTEIKQYEDKQVNSLVTSQKYLIEVEAKLNQGQHGSSDVFAPIDIMKQESYYSQYIQNIIKQNINQSFIDYFIKKIVFLKEDSSIFQCKKQKLQRNLCNMLDQQRNSQYLLGKLINYFDCFGYILLVEVKDNLEYIVLNLPTSKKRYLFNSIQFISQKERKDFYLQIFMKQEIKLNLRVVNNDGNLLDALLLAAQFELFNCEVNQTVVKIVDGALQLEIIQDKKRNLQFNIEDFLYPVQCSLFQNEVILVDPSNFEQEYSEANIQAISSLNEKTQSINKLGARDVKFEALEIVSQKATQITKQRTEKLFELINTHKQEFTL